MIENRHPIFEWSPGHKIVDIDILIPNNDQIMEGENEEEILNRNNEEI